MKVCIKSDRGYYQKSNTASIHVTHGRFVQDIKYATKYDKELDEDKLRRAMSDVLDYCEIPELEVIENEK